MKEYRFVLNIRVLILFFALIINVHSTYGQIENQFLEEIPRTFLGVPLLSQRNVVKSILKSNGYVVGDETKDSMIVAEDVFLGSRRFVGVIMEIDEKDRIWAVHYMAYFNDMSILSAFVKELTDDFKKKYIMRDNTDTSNPSSPVWFEFKGRNTGTHISLWVTKRTDGYEVDCTLYDTPSWLKHLNL